MRGKAGLAATMVLLLGTAALAGCGSNDGSNEPPTGSNEIVVQISTGGGFVPVEYNYTSLPEFSLYGDGRVIVTGPVEAIYPPRALPNLQTAVIDRGAVEAILAAAKEAGLLDAGFDYGQPGITDVGTTTFVVNADGVAYKTEVYALGMEEGAGGLTMAQQQARAALSELRGRLVDLSAFVAAEIAWTSYDYSALAVYFREVDPSQGSGDTEVQPNELDWPLADFATVGEAAPPDLRRVVVSGQDLVALRSLLDKATSITLWKTGGTFYNLFFRPLLPNETAETLATGS